MIIKCGDMNPKNYKFQPMCHPRLVYGYLLLLLASTQTCINILVSCFDKLASFWTIKIILFWVTLCISSKNLLGILLSMASCNEFNYLPPWIILIIEQLLDCQNSPFFLLIFCQAQPYFYFYPCVLSSFFSLLVLFPHFCILVAIIWQQSLG